MPQPSSQFLDLVTHQIATPVYESPALKGTQPRLTVLTLAQPNTPPESQYYFYRRGGIDSVAFILYDSTRPRPFQLLSQWHGPLARFQFGAFTGSFDKPLTLQQHLIEEVYEEAGYRVSSSRLHFISLEPVSHNTDERVHLYAIDITGISPKPPHPENIFEANMRRYWCTRTAALRYAEWKAQIILTHFNPEVTS